MALFSMVTKNIHLGKPGQYCLCESIGKEVYYRSQYGYSTIWASTALTTDERSGKGVL